MTKQTTSRLDAFASLRWYEATITFVFHFIARISEVLLAAGLVVSTANFLTDGTVMGHNDQLTTAWAWAQALAIDSSLGVTFFSVFSCLKQREWLKAGLYGLLTLLLALVAGTITNIDTFSHALHASMASATAQVGLDLKVLTTLRAIAVIGFVMMSRLKEVSFRELALSEPLNGREPKPRESEPDVKPAEPDLQAFRVLMALLKRADAAQDVAPLLHVLTQHGTTTVMEERLALLVQEKAQVSSDTEATSSTGEPKTNDPEPREPDAESQEERNVRIERAYLDLKGEGKRISGRALAERAHVHRSTCTRWLEQYQYTALPEIAEPQEPSAEHLLTYEQEEEPDKTRPEETGTSRGMYEKRKNEEK